MQLNVMEAAAAKKAAVQEPKRPATAGMPPPPRPQVQLQSVKSRPAERLWPPAVYPK